MQKFKILGINHVGLAPKDPATAGHFLNSLLGLAHLGDELVAEQMTETKMYTSHSNGENDTGPRLEVLANEDGKDGPIAKFIAKKGAGIHHLALSVDNVEAAIAYLRTKQVRMIDETPRNGAHHTRIAFIHPEATGGLLIELVEESSTSHHADHSV